MTLTDPATTVCATHDQVTACAGMPDGAPCDSQADSQCRDGVCWPFRCGDGRLDPGEACDDGNTLDGDGCSSTCTSKEVCGNGIADPVHRVVQPDGTVRIDLLEQCDDGNVVDHDGCNTHCELEQPEWTRLLPDQPSFFRGGSIAYDADHAQLVMFGDTNNAGGGTWLWDGVQWLPTHPASSPGNLAETAMAYDADTRRIVIFGGTATTGEVADTWEWTGKTWAKRTVATPPPRRAGAAMAYDSARKRIVMFGGRYTQLDSPDGIFLDDTWEWDGAKWSAVMPATGPSSRASAAMAYDPVHGVAVMFGGAPRGHNGIFQPYGETWTWDGTAWTKRTPATSPPARTSAMIAWDAASQRIILYGGNDGTRSLQDMWSWDGTTWTALGATNPPALAEGAMMAGDPVRKRVLLFGATGAVTWEWNGGAWLDVTPATPNVPDSAAAFDARRGRAVLFAATVALETTGTDWFTSSVAAPGARQLPALSYDPKRRVTVLFGGAAQFGIPASDTWTWDGVTWTSPMVANPPPARAGAQMAYDRARDQIVMFGGIDATETVLAETWLWDGTSWHDAAPAHAPPPRDAFALAYDEKHERLILYGGETDGGSVLGDTWSWDGHDWTALTTANQPGPRSGAALAWHARRQRLVMFGGGGSGDFEGTSDAWEWDGAAWIPIEAINPPPPRVRTVAFPAPLGIYIAGGHGNTLSGLQDVWLLSWDSPRQSESCRLDVDDDGDGHAGCDDPDCAYVCAPSCAGLTTCDASLPRCGDGTCDPLETCRTCASDCTCTAVCGDAFCDPPETHASCPGDCP